MKAMSVRLRTIWIALFAINGRASASTARWSTRAMPEASIFWAGRVPATLIEAVRVFMGEPAIVAQAARQRRAAGRHRAADVAPGGTCRRGLR